MGLGGKLAWTPQGAFLSVLSYCLVRLWGLSQPDSSQGQPRGLDFGLQQPGQTVPEWATTPGPSVVVAGRGAKGRGRKADSTGRGDVGGSGQSSWSDVGVPPDTGNSRDRGSHRHPRLSGGFPLHTAGSESGAGGSEHLSTRFVGYQTKSALFVGRLQAD